MASWPEGDGAGMSTGSCWPDVSVSAQVVDVSRRGCSGSLGSGRSAGCAIGEGRTSPRLGATAGIRGDHVPGGLHALAWLPGPLTARERSARGVLTRSDRSLRAASGAYRGTSVFSERPPARVAVLCGLGFRDDARARGALGANRIRHATPSSRLTRSMAVRAHRCCSCGQFTTLPAEGLSTRSHGARGLVTRGLVTGGPAGSSQALGSSWCKA